MVGKFAAVLGPFLVAGFAWFTGSSRAAIFSIVILFVAGGWLLARVDVDQAARPAEPDTSKPSA
jgi:UMF1 family MFS transporter